MKVASLFAALSLKPEKKGFLTAERLISGVKVALVGMIGIKTVGWFKDLFMDVAATADQFNKMSHTVGISSESLQGLEYAAQLSGTSLEVIRNALQRFARSADGANRGMKNAKEAFAELGVEIKDEEGKLRDIEQMMLDAADAIAAMPNGTEKTAKAMILFGRAGAQMLPFLNQGRSGIEAMKKEFGELGGLISTETGKKFENLNDDMLRVKTVVRGLKQQLAIALLPAIQGATTGVLEWVKSNRELIATKIRSFVEGFVKVARAAWTVLTHIFEVVGTLASGMWELAEAVVDLIGGWETVKAVMEGMLTVFKAAIGLVTALVRGMKSLIEGTLEWLGLRVNLFDEGKNAGVLQPGSEEYEMARSQYVKAGQVRFDANSLPDFNFAAPAPRRSRLGRERSKIDARSTINVTVNASEGMDEEQAAGIARREVKKEFDEVVRKIDLSQLPDY